MCKKSFFFIGILILTAIQITAAAPIVVDDGESAPTVWDKKVNCTLQRVTDHPQAGAGALRLSLDLTQFGFGWCFRSLPAASYTAARGIHFFARVPEGSDCQVRVQLMLPGADEVSYLGSSPLRVSGPEWQELYVPFSDLRLERGPAVAFKTSLLSPDVRLQLTVEGATGKNAVFDFDNVSLLQGAEADALAQRFRRMQTNHLLLPEDPAWAKAHPRLLFSPATLPAIRRRIATGIPAQALARLREEADQVCNPAAKGYMDPDKLFAGLTPIMAQPNSHELSGRLEGVVVSNTGPIERMVFLYQVTGEKRYGEQGARLLVAAARRLPADDPAWSKAFYYTRTFQVRALTFGYDWLYDRLTPAERMEVKASLLEYARD
ncbi:MAG TPA: hypothetical protein VHR86_04875, partial [Armatimonadota bacterium]|nr:hypothetical protein [Armatimonadota bacterium]